MSNLPYITSAVNGIKVPLLPGQAGIMHRFRNPENRLVISEVTESGRIDSDERMVIESTKESEVPVVPARRPAAKASATPTPAKSKTQTAAAPTAGSDLPDAVTL